VISAIRAKLFYNYAQLKNGKVESLRLLDYTRLRENSNILATDQPAQREFEDLSYFAESFLLKGNLGRFLVKEERDSKGNEQDANEPIDKS
jgi:hypothetical protein